MTTEELSTRDKILYKAHRLFADKGFNGVSIREIARECDVNVAAINYHFKNKESLYLQTIKESITETEKELKEIYDNLEEKNIEEFSLAIFRHFMNNADDLRTGFKLVISSDRYHEAMDFDINRYKGPPGGEYLHKCIEEEIPGASADDIGWAVRTIFTQIIHKAIISCSCSIMESMKEMGMSKEVFEEDLKRLVKIVKAEVI